MIEQIYYCACCKNSFDDPNAMCWVKGVVRRKCKKCHASEESVRRKKMCPDKIRKAGREVYRKKMERLSTLDESVESDLKLAIKLWVQGTTTRTTESRFKKREKLNRDNLTRLCFVAKEIFPYITFNNRRKEGATTTHWASLDRIDPLKPYSDDNVVVVPLWLNSAKLNSSYVEVFKLFTLVDIERFLKHVEDCKKGCDNALGLGK